jgi:hypothetical protein
MAVSSADRCLMSWSAISVSMGIGVMYIEMTIRAFGPAIIRGNDSPWTAPPVNSKNSFSAANYSILCIDIELSPVTINILPVKAPVPSPSGIR